MEFRHLLPSEIKCRVKTSRIKKDSKGNKTAWTMLLLYKDPKIFEMAVNEALDIVIQISKKSLGKGKIQRYVSEIKDFKT